MYRFVITFSVAELFDMYVVYMKIHTHVFQHILYIFILNFPLTCEKMKI